MIRSLMRRLTVLLVWGTLALSSARADDEPAPGTPGAGADSTNFVFPAFLAILFTIVVLFILCKPNRKG